MLTDVGTSACSNHSSVCLGGDSGSPHVQSTYCSGRGGESMTSSPPPKSGYSPNYVQYYDQSTDNFELLLNETTYCKTKYLVKQCDCDLKILPSTCLKNNCTKCKDFVTSRRADRAFDKIKSFEYNRAGRFFLPNICYTVFTIPFELRHRFINRKKIDELRRAVWKLLKTKFNGKFAVEFTHPIAEKKPSVFHPHLNFIWLTKNNNQAYIDVEALNKAYSKLLGYDKTVDVKHNYYHNYDEVYHKIKYALRNFPEYATWCGQVRYFGKRIKVTKEKKDCICEKCKGKFIALGFLSAEKSREYEQYLRDGGTSPPEVLMYDIDMFCE